MLPTLFNHNGFVLYSYPLLMGVAWGLAYNLINHLTDKLSISRKGIFALFWGAFIFAWIGAKVFFLATYPKAASYFIYSNSFWLGGGFVFYGGLIFGSLFILLYCTLLKRFPISQCHIFLPVLALAHSIGRVGCLAAGCCFGTESSVPWSVFLHNASRHPVQLYEAISLFILFVVLYRFTVKRKVLAVWCSYFVGYPLIRFTLEFFRGDKIRGIYWGGLSTSQLISILIIIIAVVFYFAKREKVHE